jgi:AraC family transcriptional regulator
MSNAPLFEAEAWAGIEPGWRQLYGSFDTLGVSVEEHDFRTNKEVDWARSFHPESIELCLNMQGQGEVRSGSGTLRYEERTAGFLAVNDGRMRAWRRANERHLFVTVELSREFLRRHVGDGAGLVPAARKFVEGSALKSMLGAAVPLTGAHEAVAISLRRPPVAAAAHALWFQSKVLELISQLLFVPPDGEELFCSRQKRVARERIEAAMTILRNQLHDPPSLDQLSKMLGSSPFHLSRTFSEETGMTIPLFIRKLRMERAAELLASGGYNVTQAAFEVGYSSLGHFSKSFCEVIGCCPSLYPEAKALAHKRG